MARSKKAKAGKTESILELKDRLNAKFGEGTALTGADVADLRIEFFSTGSFALDLSLRGGYAYNRIIELIGNESSVKTTDCHLAANEFLADNPTGIIVHCDLENALDFQWMRKLGCDLSKETGRFLFAYADSGEQAGDIVDEILADAAVPVFVIVDSIMAMVPMIELDSTMDQGLMGKHPALINRVIRITNSRIKKAKVGQCARTTLLLVNQTRPEMNSSYQDPGASSGGQGRKFFTGQRIAFNATTPKELKQDNSMGEVKQRTTYGKRIHYTVLKNKCGGPEETGYFTFYGRKWGEYPRGIDNVEATLHGGLLYNVIKKKGNALMWKDRKLGGNMSYAMKNLRKDPALVRKLQERILYVAREEFGTIASEESTEAETRKVSGRKLRFSA